MTIAKNNITGDLIKSKLSNKAFEDNFDFIFRNKQPNEALDNSNDELWQQDCEKPIKTILEQK